jgi:hypothetical protein
MIRGPYQVDGESGRGAEAFVKKVEDKLRTRGLRIRTVVEATADWNWVPPES